ncbi:MAG TPA: acetyl-CoA acetyltransferase [Kofleriaceae bacterium]|jgi:acetyl-CoA C-acetyltransferase
MVFILGGVQSDFARHLAREGMGLDGLVGEMVDQVSAHARIEVSEIEAIHVGNAFGELFTGQAQMGALPATARPVLWGVPASRHEAACASGSIAILSAMRDIDAGVYDCVLVVGVEQERNVSGDVGAKHMGAAAWVGHEGESARYVWPHMFSRIADAYAERWGLQHDHLVAIAKKNLANARKNPLAQTRTWEWTDSTFGDDKLNAVVEGRLRRYDCAQVTDGAAAIVLASPAFARRHAERVGVKSPRITGWGHRTAALGLDAKLARHTDKTQLLVPHLAQAFSDALRRAEVPNVHALSGIEVHDCFTITEYMAVEHVGLAAPGEAYKFIEAPTLPINPSGGLIGGGHPVGATGVRMLVDAMKQVTGTAGDTQVAGASTFATLNIGGSATTAVAFVVESPDANGTALSG